MRENRLYGSEGGVARQRHPYPYPGDAFDDVPGGPDELKIPNL